MTISGIWGNPLHFFMHNPNPSKTEAFNPLDALWRTSENNEQYKAR